MFFINTIINLFILITFISSISPAFAQQPVARPASRLSGTVVDGSTGKPVAYASVAVVGSDGKYSSGGACGSDGQFVLTGILPGVYTVKVSFLGYQDLTQPGVVVPADESPITLGTLTLTASPQKLAEVVVVAQHPLIEEKVDRTVYNAENDQTTRGGDAIDVLRRVPLLSVDLDGNVSLRGNQNIKVLINDKPSTITANGVADALRQLPADQIKRVEVITSPSAKYDAEGSGGLINIVTKPNTLHGGQLGVDGSGGTRSGTLNLTGNYRTGSMGLALSGFGRAGYNTPGSFSNEQLTTNPGTGSQTRTSQAADTRQNQLFGRYALSWDYDIDKQNSLAASLTYGTRNATTYQDGLATRSTLLATGLTTSSVRNVQLADESGTVDASLSYTHAYQTEQRELSALALLSRNNRTYTFTNDTYAATDARDLGLSGNDNPSANQELTAQLDYQTPTAKNQLLEVGGKEIRRTVTSDYTYYGQLTNLQPNNSFNYHQNVAAGYVAYTLVLPKGFTLKPGLRYEYTSIGANFGNGTVGSTPDYGVLVPSANVLYKLPGGNVLKLAYNRRIQRPSLQFLNPNLQAANPLVQTIGNPLLRPEFTNNYELGYSTLFKQLSLSFSAFVRNTSGSIQSVRTPLDAATYPGAVLITYQNVGHEDAYGGSAFVNLNVGTKLSVSGGVDAYYAVLRNNVADPAYAARTEGFVLNGRLYGSYALPKDWGVQVFGFYRGQQVQVQGSQSGYVTYSMSVRREFAQKKASLGLGAENFFTSTTTVRTDISSPLLAQQSVSMQHLTSFKIYFGYHLGQLIAAPRSHKGIKNDDLKQDENGGGSQGGPATPAATRPVPAAPPKASSAPSGRP